eukprot:14439770-Alexandrium_andersonii.AAC.1
MCIRDSTDAPPSPDSPRMLPRALWRSPELSGAPEGSLELPVVPRSSSELAGGLRSSAMELWVITNRLWLWL